MNKRAPTSRKGRVRPARVSLAKPIVRSVGDAVLGQPGLRGVRALLIDIDDTIVRAKRGTATTALDYDTASLFHVLARAGVEFGGLTPGETQDRIERVKREIRWWHWSDFIVELGLNPKAFWDFAYELERHQVEVTGAEVLPALRRLRAAGMLLYVASNNPSSGILHKLRLAGIAHVNGCAALFDQLLGATELHAMKWEPIYWKKALAHIALDADDVAVVGDDPHDDVAVPREAGIQRSFIIKRERDFTSQLGDGAIRVRSFDEIADLLLGKGNGKC